MDPTAAWIVVEAVQSNRPEEWKAEAAVGIQGKVGAVLGMLKALVEQMVPSRRTVRSVVVALV